MSNRNKFIFLKEDIITDDISLQKNEIGFVKNDNGSTLSAYFIRSDKMVNIDKSFIEYFDPLKTGDRFPKKVCNVCHCLLDTEFFDPNQKRMIDASIIRRPSCSKCRKTIDGVSLIYAEKALWDKKKPHLEPFQCPICKKRTIPGLTSKAVLDHNHKTGKGRAWICDSCNTGLGRFKDSVELLENAIDYLETT